MSVLINSAPADSLAIDSADTGCSISEFNSVWLTLGVSGGEAICSMGCDS